MAFFLLLTFRWVITVSHCLEHEIPLNVSLGIRQDGTYETSIEVQPTNQYIYPGYFEDKWNFDIGLIKLPHPIKFSKSIQPTKLPQNCDGLPHNETVNAMGIGFSQDGQVWSDVDGKLKEGSFRTVPCDPEYQNWASVICISQADEKTMAGGDSGRLTIKKRKGENNG